MGYSVLDQKTTGGKHVKVWATETSGGYTYPALDGNTIQQVSQVARLPFIHSHVALMPDAHYGKGVPIGSVIPTLGYVIPNAVGVDIGCGMCALNTGFKVSEINVPSFMANIIGRIPVGNSSHSDESFNGVDADSLYDVRRISMEISRNMMYHMRDGYIERIVDNGRDTRQIGTLGGGNHFVELQEDSEGFAWIMIHSGSRGLGAYIGKVYHDLAKDLCKKYFSMLENPDLAYLPIDSDEGQSYMDCMNLALGYAFTNRKVMMNSCITAMRDQFSGFNPNKDEIINIHHNYAAMENHFGKNVLVHRKGATLARKGVTGIIPGSMCTKSYIVDGLGCPDSFHSCSHGSGRNFSRTEAKKRIQSGLDASQEAQLGSVSLHGVKDAHDELGSAYKDIDVVMENQRDLVSIRHGLNPVAVLKG